MEYIDITEKAGMSNSDNLDIPVFMFMDIQQQLLSKALS